jgi:hypothetical protein
MISPMAVGEMPLHPWTLIIICVCVCVSMAFHDLQETRFLLGIQKHVPSTILRINGMNDFHR